jgi:hypothetical protein
MTTFQMMKINKSCKEGSVILFFKGGVSNWDDFAIISFFTI